MRRSIPVAWLGVVTVLVMLSWCLNGVLLYGLERMRTAGLSATREARSALSGLMVQTVEASVPLRHSFPVRARVPFQQEFVIPIQTTIPISTVARVPVRIPLVGVTRLAIPVQVDVPVDLQVVVPLSQTLEVDTTVAVDTEVPVRVDLGRLGLDELLGRIDTALAQIEQGLEWP